MKNQINIIALLFSLISISTACTKELGLENKYNNRSSSYNPEINQIYDPKTFKDFGFAKVGPPNIITLQNSVDHKGYFPDGKISIFKNNINDTYTTYIGTPATVRLESNTSNLEEYINNLTSSNRVFGKGLSTTTSGLDDGGAWFTGVFSLGNGKIAAFYHAESHWEESQSGHAYKSVAVTFSEDNGYTWTKGKRIIASDYKKPEEPTWSGLGDCCVVYNDTLKKYICYYSGKYKNNYYICMAASSNKEDLSTNWKKWNGEDFSIEGCNELTQTGGENVAIKGLSDKAGANPSVMWNKYLNKWIMTYHTWDKSIVASTSKDGINWSKPVTLINSNDELAMYPNLVSEMGDLEGNQILKMYYSSNMNEYGIRELAFRYIIID